MSKNFEQIDLLCRENDKLRKLWRLRDAIVDAALQWDLKKLKVLVVSHKQTEKEIVK